MRLTCLCWILACTACGRPASAEHCYASGKIYGDLDPAVMGHWKQTTPFYGMDLTITKDSIAYSAYSERAPESPPEYFMIAEGRTFTIVFPAGQTCLTYNLLEVDGQSVLISDVELGRYRALEDSEEAAFFKDQLETGRRRVTDEAAVEPAGVTSGKP